MKKTIQANKRKQTSQQCADWHEYVTEAEKFNLSSPSVVTALEAQKGKYKKGMTLQLDAHRESTEEDIGKLTLPHPHSNLPTNVVSVEDTRRAMNFTLQISDRWKSISVAWTW
eukprot:8365254-Ditylum_brightwellii.AAC.1